MAETTTTPAVEQQPTLAPNYDEIFSKLDAILDKRADGLAKSALKDNGVEEGEIADIVKAYRDQKQAKANEQATALSDAQKTIADLQKQIADRALDDAFSTAALALGIEAKQIPYVSVSVFYHFKYLFFAVYRIYFYKKNFKNIKKHIDF